MKVPDCVKIAVVFPFALVASAGIAVVMAAKTAEDYVAAWLLGEEW